MPDRPKISFANLVYLLQSRRQQARVFGPAALLLLFGVIFTLGSLTGAVALHQRPFNLVAAALAALATFTAWGFYQTYHAHAPQRVRSVLIATIAVIVGALLLLTGGGVGVLWSVLLAALGLNLTLAVRDDA